MMRRTVVAAVATTVLAGVAANCGSAHPTGIGPTGPSSPTLLSLMITGPSVIAPGQTVSLFATGRMSNGTTEDYTRKITWSASPPSVLTITPDTGVATAQSVGDATILAVFLGFSAHFSVTVLPPNTYRLTGKVLESGLPVEGATITVQSGVGAGLSATTDTDGAYRLYGVAGTIQVKFSKPGYDDVVKTFTATQNDVLDFPEAHQSGGVPSLAGTYTLTLTADPACPTVVTHGIAPLPDDFRQPRSYAASLTQNGPTVTVTLTGSNIVAGRNQFSGRIEPGAIEFQIDSYNYYFNTLYRIAEQLSSTQQFEFGGQLHTELFGSGIAGRLDGTLEISDDFGGIKAQCVASNNRVTLTRAGQPSRHR
jgi:hypothetical protein